MKLDSIGKILVGGFGDKVLIGILIGFLDDVTPYRCYEYIKNDLELFSKATSRDWQKLKQMSVNIDVNLLTSENIMRELGKHRLDLLGVILNHPKGEEWLEKQMVEIKKKLVS